MNEWQPVLEVGAKALIPKIFDKALSISSKSFREKAPYSKLTFEQYFEYSYRRCTLVKTIVNGDAPIKLLENYVNPNFRHKNISLDEYIHRQHIFFEKNSFSWFGRLRKKYVHAISLDCMFG
jgi:hypothetical protein